jgi:beta-glucanase (GH16 family)
MSSRTPRATLIRWPLSAVLIAAVAFGLYESGVISKVTPAHRVLSSEVKAQPSGSGRREPMPVGNILGWRQVFTDNFSGRKLDLTKWRLYWGRPGGDPAGWFDPRHVRVSHGMLVISGYRDRADDGRWATGGLSSSIGLKQTYGKYLVRFRLDRGVGIGHAVLLMPANNSWPPELDMSEDNGSNRTGTLATLHYGKHDKHWSAFLSHLNLTQWHTLGVEWTPGKLQYTVDGRVWETMQGNVVPAVPMVLDIQTEAWPCRGTWGRCPNASTPRVVRMRVDWVVAYAPAGGVQKSTSTGVGK